MIREGKFGWRALMSKYSSSNWRCQSHLPFPSLIEPAQFISLIYHNELRKETIFSQLHKVEVFKMFSECSNSPPDPLVAMVEGSWWCLAAGLLAGRVNLHFHLNGQTCVWGDSSVCSIMRRKIKTDRK